MFDLHPLIYFALWAGLIVWTLALCVSAHRADDDAHHALDDREVVDNVRPLSSAVTRPPAADPVEAWMRKGVDADTAVERVYVERRLP